MALDGESELKLSPPSTSPSPSEVFSQLPETDCPGPEETEEGARNLYAPSWWPRQVPFMRQLIETEEERK